MKELDTPDVDTPYIETPDIETSRPGGPIRHASRDEKLLPLVGWITYICGFAWVGVIIAYIDRGNAPPPTRDNYLYMIWTFWLSVLYALVLSGVAVFVVFQSFSEHAPAGFNTGKGEVTGANPMIGTIIGLQVVFAVFGLWFFARCIRGLVALVRETPIRNPRTWLV